MQAVGHVAELDHLRHVKNVFTCASDGKVLLRTSGAEGATYPRKSPHGWLRPFRIVWLRLGPCAPEGVESRAVVFDSEEQRIGRETAAEPARHRELRHQMNIRPTGDLAI